MAFTVLIIGGYGFFGERLARRLASAADLDVIIAGRNLVAAQNLASGLQTAGGARVSARHLDATDPQLSDTLRTIGPQVVVHTSGPFQGQTYHVAESCIEAGVHYLDLADGRDFVAGIGALNRGARQANVLVVSGASSVPALSSAVVDEAAKDLSRIDAIDIGISPGNRTDRGIATVRAILSYCGAAFPAWIDARLQNVYGWCDATRYSYPAPVAGRWLSRCDVPDLELFPTRYAGVKTVTFRAGLELAPLHIGMCTLAWLKRMGLISDWARYAQPLHRIGNLCKRFGSDSGAMHVEIRGKNLSGAQVHRRWILIARDGDGPYVPTMASAALIRKLARNEIDARGAMPCMGMLEVSDFVAQMQGLAIEVAWSDL
jgi:saccharopine dehydrogenase-like NADP-dependent oxidoreductase